MQWKERCAQETACIEEGAPPPERSLCKTFAEQDSLEYFEGFVDAVLGSEVDVTPEAGLAILTAVADLEACNASYGSFECG